MIRLTRSLPYKEIPDNENGKTLNELRIRRLETFSVSKRPTKIPRAPLLTPEGDIVQKAADILFPMRYGPELNAEIGKHLKD